MLHYKPITVERARVQYFRAVDEIRFAGNEIERDRAKSVKRKAAQMLQNAMRIERNQKDARKRARTRRRVDWNVAVF